MKTPEYESRRTFLKKSAAATTLLAGLDLGALSRVVTEPQSQEQPWYRRTIRWGQTNVREADVADYDIDWWRRHWKRTKTQGVIINAGGIVAYYPSKFPLHYRAAGLGERDLFGELASAARKDGLVVIARMDSNRTHEDFYRAHPDWFALDANGGVYRNTGLYVTCVNSPYYDEYIPSVLREIVERSHPEGFADNSWSGLGRDSMCYCANCERKFREKTGQPIPRAKNWEEASYRQWIQWNYARRIEIWDLFNRATRGAGGPQCLWIGMNSGSVSGQSRVFRDHKLICERSEMVLLDHQFRSDATGFQSNGDAGKIVHQLAGWDKVVPESMAMYQAGRNMFRLSSKPAAEARMWMLDGFAGGIQPWWHHVGAYHEDRRMLQTAEPTMRWHAENEQYLVNRQPVASVALVWSQQNVDYYGRDNPDELYDLPWRGWVNALVRARIPYLPLHADHVARDAERFSTLILPDVGAMSASQVDAVRRFVARGGNLVATGDTSRFDEWGDSRTDYALNDVFGVHAGPEVATRRTTAQTLHTYLRLTPELSANAYGPKRSNESRVVGSRHPVFKGFDETDILPFGGTLSTLRLDAGARALATFIPAFPVFPPEDAYMRTARTDIPALIVNEVPSRGRVVFMPADLDRRYGRDNLSDHGDVLANLVRWTAGDSIPLHVEGAGFIDCHLYRQTNRLVLHLVNLTSAGTWRAPVEELTRVGPLRVRVRVPNTMRTSRAQLLVAKRATTIEMKRGWAEFDVPAILDHEVAVIA